MLPDGVDVAQHFFHATAYFFPILAQLNSLAAQGIDLLFALFELLTQALGVALGRLGFARRLVQFNSAINLLFQGLEIVGGNLGRYLFNSFENHGELHPKRKLRT